MDNSFTENCSLLIQGPFNERSLGYLDFYKNEIIFSTWKNNNLNIDISENERIKVVVEELPDVTNTYNVTNIYYQCKSVLNGLLKCSKPYVIKLRSDSFYSNLHLLHQKSLDLDKLIYLPICFRKSRLCLYHPSDHVFCYKREDMIKWFSYCVERLEQPGSSHAGNEMFLFRTFLTDFKKEILLNTVEHSNEMLKKYCDIIPMSEVKPFIVAMNHLKLSESGRYLFENDSSFQTPCIDVINSMNELI